MSEPNPYAPPAVTEPEASSVLYWQCYGARVMGRNGAVLPKVDLETGVSEGEMTGVWRSYQTVGGIRFLGLILPVSLFIYVRNTFGIGQDWPMWAFIVMFVFVGKILRVGSSNDSITLWEFRESARERRRLLRQRWRLGMLCFSFLLMIGGPMLLEHFAPFGSAWPLRLLSCGMGLLLVNGIWKLVDRPKTHCERGPAGWLRIRNVQPEAMVKLRQIEAEDRAKIAAAPEPRKRRVCTSFYHRYPISSLLGNRRVNPLTFLLVIVMKLFRSKRLERESFDFSEALEIREDEAHVKLRESIHSWQENHPDWPLIHVERLPSPAGDLMTESALLVSPSFEHFLCLNHSWLEQKSTSGTGGFTILTWLKDGKMLCTTPMPLLPIDRLNVDTVRVKGTADEVFQFHLARCSSRETNPARSREEVLDRFRHEKEELRELLEKAGLQGPVREVG